MFEKIKRKTCVQRVFFFFFFTEFIYKDFINRDIVFSIFTTLSHWKYCYKHFTIMSICFRYPVFLKSSICR